MPEHFRALIVIIGLATAVFAVAKAPACAAATAAGDFERRRNLWFAVTLAAFFSHNYWVHLIAVAALLLFSLPREQNKLAMYFLLLFALPPISVEIRGFGVVNQLFTIHYLRLLSLVILLPAYLQLRRQPGVDRFGQSLPDKLIGAFIVLNLLLQLKGNTFTNALRHGLFYQFVDVFLPYYVASRSARSLGMFRDALMAFAVAAMVLAATGVFETLKHWMLYTSLEDALGIRWALGDYLVRGEGGRLRAQGTTGQPIPFGYVMAVAIGCFLYLRRSVKGQVARNLGLLLLLAGLAASISRGPWVGGAVIVLVFIATGPTAITDLSRLGLLGIVITPILLLSPLGQTLIDHLPFVGTVESENVVYRQRLLEVSIELILQNPIFGAHDFALSPEMQGLRTGVGIIDIVNSYVGVGLANGVIGVILFAGFFAAAGYGVLAAMRHAGPHGGELHALGRALLATLLGIVLIIFTVSSITIIPVIYWAIGGLCVAYARLPALAAAPDAAARHRGLGPVGRHRVFR